MPLTKKEEDRSMPTKKEQRCNWLIWRFGQAVVQVHGVDCDLIEDWVKKVAFSTGAHVDWHYAGGRAIVRHLGLASSYAQVRWSIEYMRRDIEQAGGSVHFM